MAKEITITDTQAAFLKSLVKLAHSEMSAERVNEQQLKDIETAEEILWMLGQNF